MSKRFSITVFLLVVLMVLPTYADAMIPTVITALQIKPLSSDPLATPTIPILNSDQEAPVDTNIPVTPTTASATTTGSTSFVEICTDATWFEPSTGKAAVVQINGPASGGIHDIPNAKPIWGQLVQANSSTTLTRAFTLPADAINISGTAKFVADDGVTFSLNTAEVGNYDAMYWPPPTSRQLINLRPGENVFSARVYNRPSYAWFEACATISYSTSGGTDAAELASQSEYPTVTPGATVNFWINVRNTGTTTWRASDGYGWRGDDQWRGRSGSMWRDVPPGDILSFSETFNAPTAPGEYVYGFMLRHGIQEFGPYFFLRVIVQAPEISKIEINQALGNTTNYVAGKNTAVRVHLKSGQAVPYDPVNQKLVVYRDSDFVNQLMPQSFSGFSNVLTFLCNLSDCGQWRKGTYSFQASINGATHLTGGKTFQDRRPLNILLVPIKVKANGVVKSPSGAWRAATDFLKKVYPVSKVQVTLAQNEIDATSLDIIGTNPSVPLIWMVDGKQDIRCRFPLSRTGYVCYDAIIGIVPEVQRSQIPPGTSWSLASPVAAIATESRSLQQAVAHEIGHLTGAVGEIPGLGDEYYDILGPGVFRCNNNPPPAGYVGYIWLIPIRLQGSCPPPNPTQWDGQLGVRVNLTEDAPMDVLRPNSIKSDRLAFMGGTYMDASNPDPWVSPAEYNYLFDQVVPKAFETTAQQAPQVERVLFLSGVVGQDDGIQLAPSHESITTAPAAETGAYQVDVLDDQRNALASQGFDVSFFMLSNPPQTVDSAPFAVAVRFPATSRKVRLTHNGAILREWTVSTTAPTVSITSPVGGATWPATGAQTIRWRAIDADGDALRYTVYYRQGTEGWRVLAADLTSTQLVIDANQLAGGNSTYLRIDASDGFNSTGVESTTPFTVGSKPPQAWITYPADDAVLPLGVSFFLQASAYDQEDGSLADTAYHWNSDRDGDLGTGAQRLVTLSAGLHTITLTVSDSNGNSVNAQTQLYIGAKVYLPFIRK